MYDYVWLSWLCRQMCTKTSRESDNKKLPVPTPIFQLTKSHVRLRSPLAQDMEFSKISSKPSTNADLSSIGYVGIHIGTVSQKVFVLSVWDEFENHAPGANELKTIKIYNYNVYQAWIWSVWPASEINPLWLSDDRPWATVFRWWLGAIRQQRWQVSRDYSCTCLGQMS